MNIWQGNNNEKEVICPIIVLLVIDRKIDGKSRKSGYRVISVAFFVPCQD